MTNIKALKAENNKLRSEIAFQRNLTDHYKRLLLSLASAENERSHVLQQALESAAREAR